MVLLGLASGQAAQTNWWIAFTVPTVHSAVLDTVGEGERDGKPAGQPHVPVSRLALKALACLTWAPSALFGMCSF